MKKRTETRIEFLTRNVSNIIRKRQRSTPEMKKYGAEHGKPNRP